MDGLPKLPGLDFSKEIKLRHHVPQCFIYKNGYKLPKAPPCGIGNEPLEESSIAYIQKDDPIMYDPVLTYGRVQPVPVKPFRPHYVIYDKMTLTFFAFFKQSVSESPLEHYRIRNVNIIYFLEDDSITVMEPEVRNSGIPQGRLIRRGKMAKNIKGQIYSWKDFNIGMDMEMNGMVFHITDCDQFTKDFLESQGVELNVPEVKPVDPVQINREIERISKQKQQSQKENQSSDEDKLRRFLEFSGKVLRFDCILDETDLPNGEAITYQMFYFLEDDSISIKELHENRQGRDRFPMFLNRTKLPKNWKKRPVNYPSIYLERSDKEVDEYYQPKDFKVGDTIFVYGRRFLLLDCDKFTRRYFSDVLKSPQGDKLFIKFPEQTSRQRPIPDYLGLGTPEDSLASCFGLTPKPPKKDVVKYLLNANKFLRYSCILDSAHPEDQIRKFILSYSLADDTISIMEPPIRNSGIIGGKFLSPSRIQTPGCDPKMPIYYGPKELYIGAHLKINCHRFRITGVDLYVYRYMKEHPELFTREVIKNVMKHLLLEGNLKDEIKAAIQNDMYEVEPEKEKSHDHEVNDMEKCLRAVKMHDDVKQPDINETTLNKNTSAVDIIEESDTKQTKEDCAYKIDPLPSSRIEQNLSNLEREIQNINKES